MCLCTISWALGLRRYSKNALKALTTKAEQEVEGFLVGFECAPVGAATCHSACTLSAFLTVRSMKDRGSVCLVRLTLTAHKPPEKKKKGGGVKQNVGNSVTNTAYWKEPNRIPAQRWRNSDSARDVPANTRYAITGWTEMRGWAQPGETVCEKREAFAVNFSVQSILNGAPCGKRELITLGGVQTSLAHWLRRARPWPRWGRLAKVRLMSSVPKSAGAHG